MNLSKIFKKICFSSTEKISVTKQYLKIFNIDSPIELNKLDYDTYLLIKTIELGGEEMYNNIKKDGFLKIKSSLDLFFKNYFESKNQLIGK